MAGKTPRRKPVVRDSPSLYLHAHNVFEQLATISNSSRGHFGNGDGHEFVKAFRSGVWSNVIRFFKKTPTFRIYGDLFRQLNDVFGANLRMFIGNYWISGSFKRLLIEPPVLRTDGGFCDLDEVDKPYGFDVDRLRLVFGTPKNPGLFRDATAKQANRRASERMFESFSSLLFDQAQNKRQIIICENADGIDQSDHLQRILITFPELRDLRIRFKEMTGAVAFDDYDTFLRYVNEVCIETIGQGRRDAVVASLSDTLSKKLGVKKEKFAAAGLLANLLMVLYADPNWRYLWFVPARLPNDVSAGGLVLFLDDLPYGAGTQMRHPRVISLIQFVVNAVVAYPTYVMIREDREAHARRSAAAAILGRNMSHNVGSHVTPHTSVDELLRRLRSLVFQDAEWTTRFWRDVAFPAVAGLKDRLDDYIQRKAEFIAEFSTDPLISSRSVLFYRDLLLPFLCNTALIDSLAATENFRYADDSDAGIDIRCFKTEAGRSQEYKPVFGTEWGDDLQREMPHSVPYALRHPRIPTELSVAVSGPDDVPVALPGPVGEMAFYGIIENIVRNAAKHGANRLPLGVAAGDTGPKRLRIDIDIDAGTPADREVRVTIHDKLTVADGNLLGRINDAIRAPLIDKDGEYRKQAWGIAEMVLCADLLGGYPPNDPPEERSLKVLLSDDHLAYTFGILKAWTAILYVSNAQAAEKERLARLGLLVIDDPINQAEPPAAEFTVISSELLRADTLQRRLRAMQFRQLVVSDEECDVTELPRNTAVVRERPIWRDDRASNEVWLWQKWLHHLNRLHHDAGTPVAVKLFLQQERGHNPTAALVTLADRYNATTADSQLPAHVEVWGVDRGEVVRLTQAAAPESAHRLIIDRHGILLSDGSYQPRSTDRLMIVDKVNPDFDILFNAAAAGPQLLRELCEVALLRVLVLDERILQKALEPLDAAESTRPSVCEAFTGYSDMRVSGWHVAERAGVHLVTHVDVDAAGERRTFDVAAQEWRDADASRFPECHLAISIDDRISAGNLRCTQWGGRRGEAAADAEVSSDLTSVDMVIIHQGIADRVAAKYGKAALDLFKALRAKADLIVESGRGIPQDLLETDHKFLHFSAIERVFRKGRVAKLSLCRTILRTNRKVSG